jgi:hypothetical protein
VLEKRVLRRIFGPKRDEVTGRKLHNAELNGLYSSSDIIQVIISRTMSWARHEARMGERIGLYRVLVGKAEVDHLEDPDVDGRIILTWIFRKWDVGIWTGLRSLRIGTGGGHL